MDTFRSMKNSGWSSKMTWAGESWKRDRKRKLLIWKEVWQTWGKQAGKNSGVISQDQKSTLTRSILPRSCNSNFLEINSCIPVHGVLHVANHKLSSIVINGQFKHYQWNYLNFEWPRTNNHVEGWHLRLKEVYTTTQHLWDHWCLQEGRSEHKDENADAESWSTTGPKTKIGEAKGETNLKVVCSIQFRSNLSEWLLTSNEI